MQERTTDAPSLQDIVSLDVSIQRYHWQPLSVHFELTVPHPTHDVNEVTCCVKFDHTTEI